MITEPRLVEIDALELAWGKSVPEQRELVRGYRESKQLRDALGETWAIIDAAGLIHLSRGVQLGPTAWLVKAYDARALSMKAMGLVS